MKLNNYFKYLFSVLVFSSTIIFAGDVTVSLHGNDPLIVNVAGATGTEEAASFNVFVYYNSTSPADAITMLNIADVNSTQLQTVFNWTSTFETKEIQTAGPYVTAGGTFNSRLSYGHSNLFDPAKDDVWPIGGVDVLILDFNPGGPGTGYIEVVGNDGLADNRATGHNVTYGTQSATPLPVELSSFSVNAVEGTKAQLQWETATEVNNYGFEIERSIISNEKAQVKSENAEASEVERKWEMVAFVEGHGNSNSIKSYTFTDKDMVGGSKFLYRLKQIDIDGTFEYSDAVEIEVLPTKYELLQNYPNPFNPETNIKFSLPENAKIAINIYNILGEKVTTLLNEELNAGFHQVNFNTNSAGYSLASGMYIYTIETKNFSQVKKMILMK